MHKYHHHLISFLTIFSLSLCPCSFVSAETSLNETHSVRELLTSVPPLIAHAGGGIPVDYADGSRVILKNTNSAEAVYHSLSIGHHIIEVDVIYTCDETDESLILSHDFPEGFSDEDFSAEDWHQYQEEVNFTTLTFYDLLCILNEYPDVYIIPDVKSEHFTEDTLVEYQLIYDQAMKIGGTGLLHRILPVIFNTQMYDTVKSIYSWPELYYSFADQEDIPDDELLSFLEGKSDITIVSVPKSRVTSELCTEIHDQNKLVNAYTVDSIDAMTALKEAGVDLFITNQISPKGYLKQYDE